MAPPPQQRPLDAQLVLGHVLGIQDRLLPGAQQRLPRHPAAIRVLRLHDLQHDAVQSRGEGEEGHAVG